MLIVLPGKNRKRKRLKRQQPAPPAGLTLVAAEYVAIEFIRLTFDRAIDITAIDGSQVTVDDASAATRYLGLGAATLIGPATVEIGLMDVSEFLGTGTSLTASPETGIVAVDDGAAWAGCTDVALPFP